MDLAGTSAVVTGAASCIGRATALSMAEQGSRVVAVDLPAALREAEPVAEIEYLAADVTDPKQVEAVFADWNGRPPLRIIVNCAGVAPFEKIVGAQGFGDAGRFARAAQINLVGTLSVMAYGAMVMAANDTSFDGQRGVVINTAPLAAIGRQDGLSTHAASRAAVIGVTLPADRDLSGLGIRVCAIAPSIVEAPLTAAVDQDGRTGPAERLACPGWFGRPDEFVLVVSSIIDNGYLNGEVICMGGAVGMRAR